jgi:hypothetical protein
VSEWLFSAISWREQGTFECSLFSPWYSWKQSLTHSLSSHRMYLVLAMISWWEQEMMLRSSLNSSNMLSWIFIVLAHWNNSQQIDISPHWLIILIMSQPVFVLVLGLIWPGLEMLVCEVYFEQNLLKIVCLSRICQDDINITSHYYHICCLIIDIYVLSCVKIKRIIYKSWIIKLKKRRFYHHIIMKVKFKLINKSTNIS